MNREQLIKAIEGNYIVIFSLDGDRNIQSVNARRYFDRKNITILELPFKFPIIDMIVQSLICLYLKKIKLYL